MTAPIEVVGDRETVLAFALGGVPGRVVLAAAEAPAVVEAAIAAARDRAAADASHPARILLVTSSVAAGTRDVIDRATLDPNAPLVLEIPGFADRPAKSRVGHFLERVLGGRP